MHRYPGIPIKNRYQRIHQIQKRKRQIGKWMDPQRGKHKSAAGIPGNQRGAKRSRIFQTAGKIFRVKPAFIEGIFVHATGNDNRKILIRGNDIHTNAGRNCC